MKGNRIGIADPVSVLAAFAAAVIIAERIS